MDRKPSFGEKVKKAVFKVLFYQNESLPSLVCKKETQGKECAGKPGLW